MPRTEDNNENLICVCILEALFSLIVEFPSIKQLGT
jgi:hypothetical protein